MFISDFDYELPEELIAQHPLERRDASRMLVVRSRQRESGATARSPSSLRSCARATRRRQQHARLPGAARGRREPTGGRVELFLCVGEEERARLGNAGAPRAQARSGRARHVRRRALCAPRSRGDRGRRAARRPLRLRTGDFDALLEEFGQMPLPPYIKRDGEDLVTARRPRALPDRLCRARAARSPRRPPGCISPRASSSELRARGVRRPRSRSTSATARSRPCARRVERAPRRRRALRDQRGGGRRASTERARAGGASSPSARRPCARSNRRPTRAGRVSGGRAARPS